MSYPSDKLTIDEYQKLSYRTAPKAYKELTHKQFELLHAVLGLTTEVGEIASAVKKHIIYRQPLDEINIIEEEGDLDWYIALLATALDTTRSIALERNITKLRKRYPEGFSEQAAIVRADKSDYAAGEGKTTRLIADLDQKLKQRILTQPLVRSDERQLTIEHILRGVYGNQFKQVSATLKDDVTTVLVYEAPHSEVQKRAVLNALLECKYKVDIEYDLRKDAPGRATIVVLFHDVDVLELTAQEHEPASPNELLPTEQQEDALLKRNEAVRTAVMQAFGDSARCVRIDDKADSLTYDTPLNHTMYKSFTVALTNLHPAEIDYVVNMYRTDRALLTITFGSHDGQDS